MAAGLSQLAIAAPALSIVLGIHSAAAQIATDGSAGPRVHLAGPEFAIDAGLGTRAGRNLFHSFDEFSLRTGERATFSGPAEIKNVISRVTGGDPSEIDGTLRSTIAGADFYLINPAGVMFGPSASLDLQGSFHVSTADELRFADGATFSASDPAGSSFTIAAPEAFGFLGAHDPAAILIDQSVLEVPTGESLSMVGGDIDIVGGPEGFVAAGAGRITLAAAAGRASLDITSGALSAERRADITLHDRGLVLTSGDGGGAIQIRGGNLVVAGQSFVVADNDGASDASGGIDVDADRVRVSGGSALTTDARGAGQGGPLRIHAPEVDLVDGRIASDALGGSTGNAGPVQVTAGSLEILEGGEIGSSTFGEGDAGRVTVAADRLLIREGGSEVVTNISSNAEAGSSGDGGSVQVAAGALEILEGGLISSNTFGEGDAGRVTVAADRLLIREGASAFLTGIVSGAEPGSFGRAGSVQVTAGSLEILEGGEISSEASSGGDAGTVRVEAGHLLIRGGASPFATAIASGAEPGSSGNAGLVQITAGVLEILEGGAISSSTSGEGDAGRITVEADGLLIRGGASELFTGIASDANPGASGDAGIVLVAAGELKVLEGGKISSITFSEGDAGTVTVEAGQLRIRRGDAPRVTGILSSAEPGSSGRAGSVRITTELLEILQGGAISSSTFSGSDGGTVGVKADRLLIWRGGSASFTGITSGAVAGSGDAGPVRIEAGDLQILGGGEISSSTSAEGDAGTVTVAADHLLIRLGASNVFAGIASSANSGSSGRAGAVRIAADRAEILDGGQILSATFGEGDAGTVAITADHLQIRGGGSKFFTGIASSAGTNGSGDVGQGNAGSVRIHAGTVDIGDRGGVSSEADGPGEAGDVIIAADRLALDGGAIRTESAAAGGGAIRLLVGDIIDLHDGDLITSVAGGADPTAGNITVDPKLLVIDGSRIRANAPAGFGGNVKIEADTILIPGGDFQALLERGDISATGGDPTRNGTVAVNAPEVDLSAGLVVLESTLVDPAPLRARCGARRDIGASSFTGIGRGGLPASPDAPLSSAQLSEARGAAIPAGIDPAGAAGTSLARPCSPLG